jgi:hypothetical protein
MTAAMSDLPPADGWTLDDLEAVPDDGVHRELLDGVVHVSPTSTSMDRITKPALFATAGIPYYWRIETNDGIAVHTYKIDPAAEMYRPIGTFEVEIDTTEPCPINIPIKRIRPRYL